MTEINEKFIAEAILRRVKPEDMGEALRKTIEAMETDDTLQGSLFNFLSRVFYNGVRDE